MQSLGFLRIQQRFTMLFYSIRGFSSSLQIAKAALKMIFSFSQMKMSKIRATIENGKMLQQRVMKYSVRKIDEKSSLSCRCLKSLGRYFAASRSKIQYCRSMQCRSRKQDFNPLLSYKQTNIQKLSSSPMQQAKKAASEFMPYVQPTSGKAKLMLLRMFVVATWPTPLKKKILFPKVLRMSLRMISWHG